MNLVDPSYELIDPCPDVHSMFLDYNDRFFKGLLGACEVKWSPRMTTCAGVCSYEVRSGMCSIRLSKPLLTLRPRKDLVETLLHEMIHAFLFVTKRNQDRDGHGPEFQYHMYRINKVAGTNITIYHSFHAEVNLYKIHHWRCDGPCRHRGPFRGWVKRASNRAPGPNDLWWAQHQATCGGKFIKVSEPPGFKSKSKGETKSKTNDTLDKWINPEKTVASDSKKTKKPGGPKRKAVGEPQKNTLDGWIVSPQKKPRIFNGSGQVLGESSGLFSGIGQTLGGSSHGRSRLLDMYDDKTRKKEGTFIEQISNRSGTVDDPIVVDGDEEYWKNVDEHPTMDEWVPKEKNNWDKVDLDETFLQIVACPNCGIEEYHMYIAQHLLECTRK